MKWLIFAALVIIELLVGCATPYQPRGLAGGFSEIQLDQNTVRVFFRGNAKTPPDTIETYTLYRCAEVTLEKGFDYFIIVESGMDVQHGAIVSPGSYQSTTNVTSMSPGYATGTTTGTYTPSVVTPFRKFGSATTIKLFRGEKPANLTNAYSAQELKTYLEPNIKR
jgi:hypothetical protein